MCSSDLNDYNVTVGGTFACQVGGTKVLTMGSGTLTIKYPGVGTTTSFVCDNVNNLTINAETSTIIAGNGSYNGVFKIYDATPYTFYNIELNTPNTTWEYTSSLGGLFTCNNLTIKGNQTQTAPALDSLYLDVSGADTQITVNGALTITGKSQQIPLTIWGNYPNTAYLGPEMIIANGTISMTDVNFVNFDAGGTATWTGTRIGDYGGNTGVTFDAPRNLYWIGNGGSWQDTAHWSLTSGGTTAFTYPLGQDTCYFDENSFSSGSQTVTLNVYFVPSMNWTGVTNNPTFSARNIAGSLDYTSGEWGWVGSQYILNPNVTVVAGDGTHLLSSPVTGTMTITTNGQSLDDWSVGYAEFNDGDYNSNTTGTFNFADSVDWGTTYVYGAGGDYVINTAVNTVFTIDTFDLARNHDSTVTWTLDSTMKILDEFDTYQNTGSGHFILAGAGEFLYDNDAVTDANLTFGTYSETEELYVPIKVAGASTTSRALYISTEGTVPSITRTTKVADGIYLQFWTSGTQYIDRLVWVGAEGALAGIYSYTSGNDASVSIAHPEISYYHIS